MVELKNVSVTYSTGVDALNNISLRINDGDFAFVVGSSGAGKSTLIKLILKEIDATSGIVMVNDYNLSKLQRKEKKIPKNHWFCISGFQADSVNDRIRKRCFRTPCY